MCALAIANARVREFKTLGVIFCANQGTRHILVAHVALRQRKRGRADSGEQNQVKCASNKMRFGGGVNLLFHFSSLVEFGARM